MHVENELDEIVTIRDHEFGEVIEEYEEQVLVQEEVLEPSLTNLADTLILDDHWIYICEVHLRYRIYIETTCIDNLPMSPTSIG